jgi:hypothetical protein
MPDDAAITEAHDGLEQDMKGASADDLIQLRAQVFGRHRLSPDIELCEDMT